MAETSLKTFKDWVSIVLFMIPFSSLAQFTPGTGEDSIKVTPNIAPHRTIAKFSVFAPIEEKNCLRLSVEFTLNDRLSIEPEIGYIYNNSIGSQRLNNNMVNGETRLGLRYYFPENILTGLYTGILMHYASDNYGTGIIRNYHPSNPDSAFYDFSNPARFHENDYALFCIIGLQPVVSRHINFDISGGFGCFAQQTTTLYDPYISASTKLPFSSIVYKAQGIISLKAGYIF